MQNLLTRNTRRGAEDGKNVEDGQLAPVESRRRGTAPGLVDQVVRQIREFEASLDDVHVAGVIVHAELTLLLEQVGFHNPALVLFVGRDMHGHPARVLQHQSQLNIALISVPRVNADEPKKPVEFDMPVGDSAG